MSEPNSSRLPDAPIGVLSSRLSRQLCDWDDWFRHLRSICAYAKQRGAPVLMAPETTCHHYLERASVLFGCRSVECHVRHLGVAQSLAEFSELPRQDIQVAVAAEQLFLLHVRQHGAIHRLARAVLELPAEQRPNVNLAMIQQTPRVVQEELLAAGAVAWLPNVIEEATTQSCDSARTSGAHATEPRQVPEVRSVSQWLLHCTRARVGSWPGEDPQVHLDDLLLGLPRADHSAFATLMRIVASRRLMASAECIRDGHAVVSFTAATLVELTSMRSYRSHRGGWDFEPYGIGICKRWLTEHGACEVIYGDEGDWKRLDAAHRPFFQKRSSGQGTRIIDWSAEREWRHIGDIDLSQLGHGDAIVFVPDEMAAVRVERICRWPVVALDSLP